MKIVRVVAAVICDSLECPTKIFATAKGYGDFKGKWEFPGGKIEVGESTESALIRGIKEELDIGVAVGQLIDTIEYDYPDFHLSMDCFWCVVTNGTIRLLEAQDARWLSRSELTSVPWLPADISIINKISYLIK